MFMVKFRFLNLLIEMKKNNIGPFEKGLVEKYYEKYKKIINE